MKYTDEDYKNVKIKFLDIAKKALGGANNVRAYAIIKNVGKIQKDGATKLQALNKIKPEIAAKLAKLGNQQEKYALRAKKAGNGSKWSN